MNIITATLAKENGLEGVIDLTEFNDPDRFGKELVNRAEGNELLADAYEFLMRNFATQSGKSADAKIYDPTCPHPFR